jgi:hypothetical protein
VISQSAIPASKKHKDRKVPEFPIWERLTDQKTGKVESPAAFDAFCKYRDLSPAQRSLRALALELSPQTDGQPKVCLQTILRGLEKWCEQWAWVVRALASDDDRDRRRCDEQRAGLKQVVRRQTQELHLAEQLLQGTIRGLADLPKTNQALLAMSDRDLFRSTQRAIRALPGIQAAERRLLDPPENANRRTREIQRPDGKGIQSVYVDERPYFGPEQGDSDPPNWAAGATGQANGETQASGQAAALPPPPPPPAAEARWSDPLWERQVHPDMDRQETAREFHKFTVFRDLPPAERTLRRATQILRGVGNQPGGQPQRRRERVSEMVESLSSKWKWIKRASAWDDEKDREQRRASMEDVKTMGLRHTQGLHVASAACRRIIVAWAARVQAAGPSLFAGEEKLLIQCASASIPLLLRVQNAERALKGNPEEYEAEKQPVRISRHEFEFVSPMCGCGHDWDEHPPSSENPRFNPCKTEGCSCQKFRERISDEQDMVESSERWCLPNHLKGADE